MAYRVLKCEFPQIERECPRCGDKMVSTGQLFHDPTGWYIAFWCRADQEYAPLWWPEDRELLAELTAGVDPSTLPGLSAKEMPASIGGSRRGGFEK